MRDWLGFFGGRVEVEARGNQTVAFLNLLHRAHIIVRAPQRAGEGILRFSIACRDFKRLRPIAFKTATKIRILKKRGLFLLIRPFRRRWGFVLGAALFFGLLFYSSAFIWQIEVRGCEEFSKTEILSDLQGMGLQVGCRRTIDVNALENRYLMGNSKLSWMSINIQGTTAYIDVKEKGLTPKIVDLSVPTNIYAQRSGIIRSVMDYSGSRMVEVGEAVMEGDLLVSGDWTDQYGVRRLSHCIATVMAETRRETVVSVPLKETKRQKTGKKRRFFEVSFGNFKIPLYFIKKISYNKYDMLEKEYPLRIASFVFPLRLRVIKAEEIEEIEITRTIEEARSMALSSLGFYEERQLSAARILRAEREEERADSQFRIRAIYICEEEIGMAMPIEE